jgi:alpha-galactosidase
MNGSYFECSDQMVFHAAGRSITLGVPCLSVDGLEVRARFSGHKEIPQDGAGGIFRFILTDQAELQMEVREYPSFIRIRYHLGGSGAHLTKVQGRDNFRYTAFTLRRESRFTEIQLNQYVGTRHAYLPQFMNRPETDWLDTVSFAGPVLLAECAGATATQGPYTLLCAYEHGGEYTDNFLAFRVDRSVETFTVGLECVRGTYWDNTFFSNHLPYLTPWFQLGLCEGGAADMLGLYRNFLLRDMPELKVSREPLIFYNTWNNQERNRAFRGRKYLEDMNTKTILEEINIAHRIGVDVFVIDTGWYKNTGDWEVDFCRFPDDLREIRALLDQYGMKLGLWFNPAAAALSSLISRKHPEYRRQLEGQDVRIGPVWETEESYGMCLVSGYAEWFIRKLIEIGRNYGVRYFKWDAVNLSGCTAPHHRHGGPETSADERELSFRFQCGMALTYIAEEVCRQLPGTIVDLDVTEGQRYMGLGFLSAGKFFHTNNGPYYHDFDIPGARDTYRENWNVFFHPGPARNQVCRQSLAYDFVIPSVLFLTHFLPDGPSRARQNALVSLYLGGNGIWGDLRSLEEPEIEEIAQGIGLYKKFAPDITAAYPRVSGFIGASPEIHEKINPRTGRGMVAFFTRAAAIIVYCTQVLDREPAVYGADAWVQLADGRIKITVFLKEDEGRAVFLGDKQGLSKS